MDINGSSAIVDKYYRWLLWMETGNCSYDFVLSYFLYIFVR